MKRMFTVLAMVLAALSISFMACSVSSDNDDSSITANGVVNAETPIISKGLADGTYTVRGILGARPDSLTVNGDAVTVDKDNVFTYNVPVKGGKVRVNIVVEKDGKKQETSAELYYNDMTVKYADTIKKDANGVINTTSKTFNLAGTITSYVNIGSMRVNGDSVFVCAESITASLDKPIVRNFNFPVELEKGMNTIVFEIYDLSGQKVVEELKVNCQ